MAGIFSFKCSSCDKVHEGSPSIACQFPDHYAQLSGEERKRLGSAHSDFCQVRDDYFIRTLLEIPIIGVSNPFLWGVWISVSKVNFFHYWDSFDEPTETQSYFGWLSNQLPWYPDALHLQAIATTRLDGNRPTIELEESDHPLALDFHRGISIQRAQEVAEIALHGTTPS